MTTLNEPGTVITNPPVSADEFRNAIGHLATGVTVVTTIGADGQPVGTTASAVASVSLDPPLVLVCFSLASLTLRAVADHGAFVINVLAEPHWQLSANFARRGLAAAWDGVTQHPGETGCPLLDDALASLECTVEDSEARGDHEVVFGRVRAVAIGRGPATPLLHWRGSYGSLLPVIA